MAKLLIPRHILTSLLKHARSEAPLECCGILGGRRSNSTWTVHSAHPLINELASPTRYRSEPGSLFRALKAVRMAGQDVVAIYHSHPTSEPVPSLIDRDWCWAEDVVDLIIGLAGDIPQCRAWLLHPWPAREVVVEEWLSSGREVRQPTHLEANLQITDPVENQVDSQKRADHPKP